MIRKLLRKILLALLKWLEPKKSRESIRGYKGPFWTKEIHIHPFLIVTIDVIFILSTLLSDQEPSLGRILGVFMFVTISVVVFILILKIEKSQLTRDNDAMMLLGLIIITSVIIIEVVKSFKLSPYFVPVSGIVLLTSLLLNRNIGLLVAVTISLLCTVINEFKFEYMFFHLLSGCAGVLISNRIKHRQDIVFAGLHISLVNVFILWTILLIMPARKELFYNSFIWGFLNGILSSAFVILLLSPLEIFFSRITDIKLLELADFNQPLLKKLMLEAPGTYHHSLTVASIAENCADVIGANSLLVRVGAYYHDIGKLTKPEYFIENQGAKDNPHDSIAPTMSGLVVLSHVKDGIILAKRYNIDKPIIEMIEQHHGTSLLYSIYQKALKKDEVMPESEFRYPGPKPKTKEAAILMLADSCEAASRTIDEPTPNRLKDMVEKIINNRFTDGQLNDAPITLNDLNKIAQKIVETLSGVHHSRLHYEENGDKKRQI